MLISESLLLFAALLLGASNNAADDQGIGSDFYFFVDEEHWGRPGFESVEGHPCGAVLPMRVSQIPEFPEGSPVIPSEIVEFNDQGDIVGVWRVPADYMVQALSGNRVLLNVHGTDWQRLWIDQAGAIEQSPRDIDNEPVQTRSCPASVRMHYGYTPFCATYIDELDGAERHIASEDVCT